MRTIHQTEGRPFDAVVDSFHTMPDGLDSPYMLLLAFKWLTPRGELAQMPHRWLSGATLLNKTRTAGLRARTLFNPIASALKGSSKK